MGIGRPDGSGNATVTQTVSEPDPAKVLTATAIRTSNGSNSEFSACQSVGLQTALPDADLALSLTPPSRLVPGTPATWTANVTNRGPGPAVATVVTFVLPSRTTFVSASPGCSHVGSSLTCAVGDIAAGGSASRAVTLTPQDEGGYLVRASARSQRSDPTLADADAQQSGQATLPDPVVAKSANVSLVKGRVLIKRRGSNKFEVLLGDAQIPIGSEVDARRGRVRLTAAAGKGKEQSAEFYEGMFIIRQVKAALPVTELVLSERLTCPRKPVRKSQRAQAAAKKRHLWGNGKGRFRTRGKHAAATVRGTIWLVADTCTSTTVRVTRGRVEVRDLVRKRNRLIRAPRSVVVRARR